MKRTIPNSTETGLSLAYALRLFALQDHHDDWHAAIFSIHRSAAMYPCSVPHIKLARSETYLLSAPPIDSVLQSTVHTLLLDSLVVERPLFIFPHVHSPIRKPVKTSRTTQGRRRWECKGRERKRREEWKLIKRRPKRGRKREHLWRQGEPNTSICGRKE